MARIDLNAKEEKMLYGILESYLSDLRMEIANTDNMDFRESLKEKEGFLKKVINQLEEKAA